MLSTFWQIWVTVIVVGSMIGCGLLITYTSRGMKKDETTETTGHSYDGIEEFDNPLPRWWVFMFWGTIIFGFLYIGMYGLGNFKGFLDRKSTRLNSSHVRISYAVFCLKKKNERV